MADLFRRIFRKREFVYRAWNGTYVHGDDFACASMMIACALALEQKGWNVEDVKTAIKQMQKEDKTNDDQ